LGLAISFGKLRPLVNCVSNPRYGGSTLAPGLSDGV